ncbi:MAG: membrane protein insertase YidC [Planctomycetota bacterium]
MAKKESNSSLARLLVPLVVGMVGMMVVLSLMDPPDRSADDKADTETAQTDPASGDKPGDEGAANAPDTNSKEDEPAEPVVADEPAAESGETVAENESTPPSDGDVDILGNLRPAFVDKAADLDEPEDLLLLGSFDPEVGYNIAARINPYRAAIYDLTIVNKYHKVNGEKQYKLLSPISFDLGTDNYPEAGSYAASYLTINSQRIKLWEQDPATTDWAGHWQVDAASETEVSLSLKILGGPDDGPVEVAEISRTYTVVKAENTGSYTIKLTQHVENLTDQTMTVAWEQMAQGGVYRATSDYLRGRSQQFVLGYFDLEYDESRFAIYVDGGFLPEPDVVKKLKDPDDDSKWESIWPNPKIDDADTKELAWLARENRYFVAVSSAVAPEISGELEPKDITALQSIYPTVKTTVYPDRNLSYSAKDETRSVIVELASNRITLEPGAKTNTADLSLDLFAGPREDAIFVQQPYKALQYEKTIRYSLGGCFGFCTFQWLANLLLSFLELLHSGFFGFGLFDWGLSIIILVIVVRLILHPLTKRGQIGMMKMGKQMAAIQPDINKLKKKFADDPRQLQQEQMKLFREKGINPAAGAVGCLPMFLQMPIWIALYAMLYYAIELRHEPAFYGVFQMIGGWPFLADLSSADRFIPIFADDGTHVLNLLFIRLDYSSINILPLLMGITFFINMKFTTPPPMNEQQAMQQKILRIMPLLFPIFLYSAPAGLTLYIFASTLAGIVDSYIVRKHVKELEDSGELFKPKQHKPGGFMDRLQKVAEAKQAQIEEAKKQQQKNKGPQQYKKRKR